MRILIEVVGGCVTNVWCEQPQGVEVVIRDLDNINTTGAREVYDPLVAIPGVAELRTPHFVVY